ncbi:substrate-binding periplasmic protein [Pseudoduganella danionis]|uniref:substrate-binding periplasmic protein n=1 Tax=Pseudoduganella danionis TaxID=1890295 RepID=UPI0035ADB54E
MCLAAVTLAAAAITATAAESATPVKMGLQSVVAPFVLPDNTSGLLVDVVRAAFATQQVKVEFRYLPNARFDDQMRQGLLDITPTTGTDAAQVGYLSHWPVTHFHNMAITLRSKIPTLSRLDDLKKYRVTAFRGARNVLGPAYAAVVGVNPDYREVVTMPSGALLLGRTDIIVSQPDIFQYYLRQQLPHQRAGDDVLAYHDVLGPGRFYWMRFRTEAQRDAFERGIAQLYATGEIDRIQQRYARDYGLTRDFFVALDCQFRPEQAPQKCKKIKEWTRPAQE